MDLKEIRWKCVD